MIRMTLEQEGQVDDVRPFVLESVPQAARHPGVTAQAGVLRIEKVKGADSQNICCAPGFGFADGNVPAKASVCQEHDRDVGLRSGVPGDRAAAAEHFVVHMRGEHHNFGLFRLADGHGQVVDR